MAVSVFSVSDAVKVRNFKRIVEAVKSGSIIIFPTDTVYGIGASTKFPKSIEKIYKIKKRPHKKKIPILISSWRDVSHIIGRITQQQRLYMKEYWPGAVTLILPYRTEKIAMRVPNHKFAMKLLSACGPIATTSANFSGKPPASKWDEIPQELLNSVEIAVKDSKHLLGYSSAILDISSDEIEVIRE